MDVIPREKYASEDVYIVERLIRQPGKINTGLIYD